MKKIAWMILIAMCCALCPGYADEVYLCNIYAARENNTTGVCSEDIASRMKNAKCPGSFESIAECLKSSLQSGDYCITMGAGEAYKVAELLLK